MPEDSISHELMLDHLQDGVIFVNREGEVTFWNRGAERILGYDRDEIVGRSCSCKALTHYDELGNPLSGEDPPALAVLRDGGSLELEVYLRNKAGELLPAVARVSTIQNSRGEVIGSLEVFSDNSSNKQVRKRIEELEALALICPLTGVGNRRYAQMALENAVDELRRNGWAFGLLFVDIDHFKTVNDTYGHQVGDYILSMVAHALNNSLRSIDFVGRWGGEEFIVILPNTPEDMLEQVAERCRRTIGEAAYQHEGKEINVTVSIGAVIAELDETAEACVERADRLMYRSKAEGRNRVSVEI